MGGKSDDVFDDDLDFNDDEDVSSDAGADESTTVSLSPRSRRNWRDVERAREEREMRRLMSPVDDWMSDFEDEPRRSRR